MHAQVELGAGALRCTVVPAVGGAIAGLWFHHTPVLRPCDGPRLRSPRDAGCFALVPFSNRVGHGRLDWQGQQHRLYSTPGDAPHAIHGVGWQRPWQVSHQTPASLDMAYQHTADALWPFPFDAKQQLELFDHRIHLTLSYQNTHTTAVPVGLGWHPYFHKGPHFRVHFSASGCWNTSWEKLPTHRTPSDGLQGATATLAVDNCFDGWNGVAHIEDDRIRTTVLADTPFLVAYTRADLDFFALEPVTHVSNAVQLAAALPCSLDSLGACRAWGVESALEERQRQNRPQRGQFLPDLQAHSPAMGQKGGVLDERRSQKWAAAADLQPTIPKSDRLLGLHALPPGHTQTFRVVLEFAEIPAV